MPELTLAWAAALFLVASAVIGVAGTRLARLADTLADRTGLGEAIAGAVLLGATTSAAGTIASIAAAADGEIDLAYANSLGGIAAQTAFLAVADIVYRRANLEHAAAEATTLSQSALLVLLLTVPLIAAMLPPVTVLGVHPASIVLMVVYVLGLKLARQAREHPMWRPRDTDVTRHDLPETESASAPPTTRLLAVFAGLVLIVGIAGYVVAQTGAVIARETGLGGSVVGALMTATATSLPELVTTIAAVRQGALQLAVGGIIGGNTFDVLFLAAADVAWRGGSIYNDVDPGARFWALVGIVMTAVLLLGLIRRERHGFGNIGFESAAILALYAGSVAAGVWLL